jgi:hypothetical protein
VEPLACPARGKGRERRVKTSCVLTTSHQTMSPSLLSQLEREAKSTSRGEHGLHQATATHHNRVHPRAPTIQHGRCARAVNFTAPGRELVGWWWSPPSDEVAYARKHDGNHRHHGEREKGARCKTRDHTTTTKHRWSVRRQEPRTLPLRPHSDTERSQLTRRQSIKQKKKQRTAEHTLQTQGLDQQATDRT